MHQLQILVAGDVQGNFRGLFKKIDQILKKKPGVFEYLFCVGNFFGSNSDEWEELKSGKVKVPLTTYVLGANELLHERFYNSLESVPNIICLGKKGCLTTTSGLKITYLSGQESSGGKTHSTHTNSVYFSENEVNDLINSLNSENVIDILLTSQWPKDITKYAVSIAKDNQPMIDHCSSYLVAKLAKALKPRYHFCGLANLHYARVPYRNHAVLIEKPAHITRFYGMAALNNPKKEKWLYAFNITPASALNSKQLTEYSGPITVCPFEFKGMSDQSDSQFFFDTTSPSPSNKRPRGGDHKNHTKKLSIDSSRCWFCLSNSSVEKQLIITIGNHCYLTLAKGPLVPKHVLIIPIKHTISSAELPDDVYEEVQKFKVALKNYFHDKNKDVVFFERNYSSPHLQIQVIPIPRGKMVEIEKSLEHFNEKYGLSCINVPGFCDMLQIVQKEPFFYMEVMINKTSTERYLYKIKQKQKFPLQFGREVLACRAVLDVEDRVDWQKCQDSRSAEEGMVVKMREDFKPYDFTDV